MTVWLDQASGWAKDILGRVPEVDLSRRVRTNYLIGMSKSAADGDTVVRAAADRPEQAGKPRSQDNRWGRLEGA